MQAIRLAVGFVAGLGVGSACTNGESKPAATSSTSGAAVADPSTIPDDAQVARFHVPDLTCEGCAATLRGLLQPHAGVFVVDADVSTRTLSVTYDPKRTTPEAIAGVLMKADYETRPLSAADALGLGQ